MINHIHWVGVEAARFHQVITGAAEEPPRPPEGWAAIGPMPVPTCPGWNVAELVWHLAEVHYFWSSIVEGNLANPGAVEPLERPGDQDLPALLAQQSARLVAALTDRNPGEPCWTWHPDGDRVGWVRRFQAHEALAHRIDAELAVGVEPAPIDEGLAADGIDVVLNVILRGQDRSKQTEFTPDGATVAVEIPDRSWLVELGHMPGDSSGGDPVPAVRVVDGADDQHPTARVTGAASEIDRWLWRRGSLPDGSVDGDRSIVDRLNELTRVE